MTDKNDSGDALVYLPSDENGHITMSKPVQLAVTQGQIEKLFHDETPLPDLVRYMDRRTELKGWLRERGMTVEYGCPWTEAPTGWMINDQVKEGQRKYGWLIGFDTEQEATEFKLRWL